MKSEIMDAIIAKIGAGTFVAASTITSAIAPEAKLPFFNVSITTLGMAAAGSLIAFAYGNPVKDRKKLIGYAVGGTFVGIWAAQFLPALFGWKWYEHVLEPPLAGAVALASRWLVPFVLDQIPALWNRLTSSPNRDSKGE